MSDIDFLANNKREDDQEPKSEADKKEKIVWSEPEDNRPIPKETAFTMLSLLKKKKAAEKTKEPLAAQGQPIDRTKIRESRQEILKLIKNHEGAGLKKKNDKPAQGGYARSEKTGPGLLARLLEKFKRPPSHKEILLDYQQVFSQEKIKRNSSAPLASAPPFAKAAAEAEPAKRAGLAGLSHVPVEALSPRAKELRAVQIKQPPSRRSEKEKRPEAPRPPKAPGESFIGNFFKFIKRIIASLTAQKERRVNVDLTEISKENPPNIIGTPRLEPSMEEKREDKTKEKALEQTEPIKIGRDLPKVIETNLIKGEIITFFDWRKKSLTLIIAILIPILLVSLIYLGLVFYQKQSQAQAQDQLNKLNQLTERIKQAELGFKEITDFQARLKIVSKIFAKHIYWTNFFKFLEDNTIKDVYYAGFSGDTGGDYPLSAIASGFSNISDQVDVFRDNQTVTDIQTTGGKFVAGSADKKAGVEFDLNLTILKSIFTE